MVAVTCEVDVDLSDINIRFIIEELVSREGWVEALNALHPFAIARGQVIDRLTLAAPDMLAALKKAVADYGHNGGPWNVPGEPGVWLAMARSAIADAEGGAL